MSELLCLLEGQVAGSVHMDRSGRLSFTYDRAWLASADSYSLSVSMQLAEVVYPHKRVFPYLWNLLPENPNVLKRWGQQYHVSENNPFKLLAHVGEDVPGAAQFIPPERREALQADKPLVEWMTIDELSGRLRQLRDDISAVRRPGDVGRMSLPGAQAKTAYLWDRERDRWGVPAGRMPTTHIIKPCVPGFEGLVENEHLCLDIAARLGLPAAKSRVLALDETYIVVERFDRLTASPANAVPRRIHQEDMCQALALMPADKYQEDGGPGIAEIVRLIRSASTNPELDVERFLKANIFNWFIGGTDAHAKNYAFLIDAGDDVRFAPLYDLSSQLPYPERIKQRLAMKIGKHYEIPRVDIDDWHMLARLCDLDGDRVIATVAAMGQAMPDEIAAARTQALKDGLSEPVVAPLVEQLVAHVGERLASITSPPTRGRPKRPRRRE
jgi:serine/threonine-protein kinase HipA